MAALAQREKYDCSMHDLLVGDCRDLARSLPANHFHSIVTSPPYYNQRDYHHRDQVGRESSPSLYIQSLVEIFREVRRTLRPDGTFWLNLGDSYARGPLPGGIKKKDLIGIPWMLAFALRADGWHFRSDIIWTKPNGTPESVRDRPSRCHEYVFLLTKTAQYFYDHHAVMESNTSPKPSGRKAAILALKGHNGGAWRRTKTCAAASSPIIRAAAISAACGGSRRRPSEPNVSAFPASHILPCFHQS